MLGFGCSISLIMAMRGTTCGLLSSKVSLTAPSIAVLLPVRLLPTSLIQLESWRISRVQVNSDMTRERVDWASQEGEKLLHEVQAAPEHFLLGIAKLVTRHRLDQSVYLLESGSQ